ncbi:bifunctional Delta(1)-pyrroline-2-carboxylate/Delta(1)-piperideine-2-carboxylate reductase [Poseidonibacter lekithochrous]|uniref:ornithine cyclodeaminase family protein n=1 Tax=Poseidonibacter lekithochrous TaxID=1904463 RepID=UPI000D3AA2B7|nr:ornithine cyclodeaminase family protein [Poseidonibacter lekithochrous]
MKFIDKDQVAKALDYPSLVEALRNAFISDIKVPPRHHHDFKNPKEGMDSTLLLMPAWEESEAVGVKIVTVSPNNAKYDLPGIHGLYVLMDAQKGNIEALIEGKTLTAKRTAAASALASSYLSRKDSTSMLMIGTGALSSELIRAHASVRDIKDVFIWGRDKSKALKIVDELKDDFNIKAIDNIEDEISNVDIISCATLSIEPLVFGKFLRHGQHVDLVGAYKPNMREADDELIQTVDIYIDTNMAKKETGDIKIPLESNTISEDDIKADLFQLTRKENRGRISDSSITLFKSVGHGLEDLAAAKLVKEKIS